MSKCLSYNTSRLKKGNSDLTHDTLIAFVTGLYTQVNVKD